MDPEGRAKHAAYMRQWTNTPERKQASRDRARRWYEANRDRILAERRAAKGSGPARHRWTDDEVIQAIRALSLDGVATCPSGGSLPGIAANRYGSWKKACEAAGVVDARSRPLRVDAKYSTVHSRLRRERGTPQNCATCGATGPGRRFEWALNLVVERPLFNEKGRPFSLNLDDYTRLCKSCHTKQDRTRPKP